MNINHTIRNLKLKYYKFWLSDFGFRLLEVGCTIWAIFYGLFILLVLPVILSVLWLLVMAIDTCLIPVYFLVWIFTGKKLYYSLHEWVDKISNNKFSYYVYEETIKTENHK